MRTGAIAAMNAPAGGDGRSNKTVFRVDTVMHIFYFDLDLHCLQQRIRKGKERKPMIKRLGLKKLLHDLQHRRDRYRQFIGISFLLLVTAAGSPHALAYWPGLLVALAGVAVRLWASGHIKKDKALATDGPYAYVRHPLYVGNILLGIGFCLASGLWWSFLLFAAILLGFYPQAIKSEDAKLHRLFEEDWENWRMHTRALIPRLKVGANPGGKWSFYQSLRQNGEPVIALILVACLYYLFLKL